MLFYNEKIFKRCFSYCKRYWYMNIKEIPLYFKLMHHLIKYGYDSYANINTYDWFMETMKSILKDFRQNHNGYPVVSFDKESQAASAKEYDAGLDTMISLLDDMDECNPKYEDEKYNDVELLLKEINDAKDKFFELFSEYFYSLWD